MKVYSISLKGARPTNEDAHEIITNLDGTNSKNKDIKR